VQNDPKEFIMKIFRILFGVTLLAGLAISSCKPAAAPEPGPTPTLMASPTPQPAPGSVLWTFETGDAIWSSPTVSAGVIYFGSDDKSVYSIDTTTHKLRWKFATGGLVRSRPAIAGGVVYVSSDDGVLYALDATSGTEKWQADLGSASMPVRGALSSGWDYQQSSPAVADGIVYVGSSAAEVDAFDTVTGQRIWQFMTTSRVRSSPTVVDGTLFIGDGNGYLYALNARTGSQIWKTQGCDYPTPAVSGGLVYCGSRSTYERAWDAGTGEQRWQFSFGRSWVESSARVVDGVLYVGSSDVASLFALDPSTGELKWSYNVRGYAWCSPAVSNGVVYIGAYSLGGEAGFYALDAKTGQPKWTLTVENGIVSSPTITNGVIYFGGMDGKLYAVSSGG
jgi:outer membrane protein assembly factor BamB